MRRAGRGAARAEAERRTATRRRSGRRGCVRRKPQGTKPSCPKSHAPCFHLHYVCPLISIYPNHGHLTSLLPLPRCAGPGWACGKSRRMNIGAHAHRICAFAAVSRMELRVVRSRSGSSANKSLDCLKRTLIFLRQRLTGLRKRALTSLAEDDGHSREHYCPRLGAWHRAKRGAEHMAREERPARGARVSSVWR